MLHSTTITRTNSEYSLQDLGRPGSRLRHSWSRTGSDAEDELSPRNSNGEGCAVVPQEGDIAPRSTEKAETKTRLGRFWGDCISCEVEMSASRDHLANERTFLGYLRTSVMMSMVGTLVAQLFSLNHKGYHTQSFGYFITGGPLAMTCYSFSIGTILLGAIRTWRHQRTMMRGKALAGGFEIHTLGICSMLLLFVFFGFLLSIDVVKDVVALPMTTASR